MNSLSAIQTAAPLSKARSQDTMARAAAEKLEANFLAEMLKHTGLREQENSFGGGVGESQFVSFQRQLLAEHMVKTGGIGLTEQIFRELMDKNNDN